MKKDGTRAEPLRVVNGNNEKWGDRLIGNGSTVDVKFVVRDYGVGKKKGVYIRAVRVLDLIPYEQKDFAPLTEDDAFFAEAPVSNAAEPAHYPLPEGLEPVADELNDDFPE